MQFSFDSFNRYEIPVLTVAEPDFTEIGVIKVPLDLKIIPRLITTSELDFTAHEMIDGVKCAYYDKLIKYRLIHAENFGWFVITDVSETGDGHNKVKEIICESYEYLLGRTDANISAGTYKFYEIGATGDKLPLLNHIFTQCPQWSVGNISNSLLNLYRTFDMPDDNIYSFLMNEVSEAYECFFIFDCENFKINALTLTDIIEDSGIVLRYQSLLRQVQMKTSDNDIATVLKVYGADDFSIAMVNPLGNANIYKLDYFKDMMPAALWAKVDAWQDAVYTARHSNEPGSYANLLSTISVANQSILDYEANIAELNSYTLSGQKVQSASLPYSLTTDERTKVEAIKTWIDGMATASLVAMLLAAVSYPPIDISSPPSSADATISSYMASLNSGANAAVSQAIINIYACEKAVVYINGLIDALESDITTYKTSLTAINTSLSLENNFTAEELATLDKYFITKTYTNDYIIDLETYDYTDRLSLAYELLDYGEAELELASQQSYQFSIEAKNFVFDKNYQSYATKLATVGLGCKIHAEVDDGIWEDPLLMEIELDFTNPDNFAMTFGDKYYSKSNRALFEDFFQGATKTSDSFNSTVHSFLEPVRDGTISDAQKFIKSALDIARNAVISGSHQEMKWDESGFWGRKWDVNNNSYDPQQLKITNNLIVMTDDNWLSGKLAIGEITVNGLTKYGIAAELLLGNMIISDSLLISNSGGTFSVDSSGATLVNADFKVETATGLGRIIANASDGFRLQTRTNTDSVWNDQISLDINDGDIAISGSLISIPDVSSVGGWANSGDDGLENIQSTNSRYARLGGSQYAFAAGTLSNGVETPRTSVDYAGNLSAVNGEFRDGSFYGTISASSGNLGKISAASYGGIVNGDLYITGALICDNYPSPSIDITPTTLGLGSATNGSLVVKYSDTKFGTRPYNTLRVKAGANGSEYTFLYSGVSVSEGTGGGTGGTTPTPPSYNIVMQSHSSYYAIRAGAGTNYAKVGEMVQGQWYVYSGINNGWYYLTHTCSYNSTTRKISSITSLSNTGYAGPGSYAQVATGTT
jgi:hypothetical protein